MEGQQGGSCDSPGKRGPAVSTTEVMVRSGRIWNIFWKFSPLDLLKNWMSDGKGREESRMVPKILV